MGVKRSWNGVGNEKTDCMGSDEGKKGFDLR